MLSKGDVEKESLIFRKSVLFVELLYKMTILDNTVEYLYWRVYIEDVSFRTSKQNKNYQVE